MTRILSLAAAAVAMGALVTTSASAAERVAIPIDHLYLLATTGPPAGGGVTVGDEKDLVQVHAPGVYDPSTKKLTAAYDPLTQALGAVENPNEAAENPGNECKGFKDEVGKTFADGSGKHNSDGVCSLEELQNGACIMNQQVPTDCQYGDKELTLGGISFPVLDVFGAVVPTRIDGNLVCDTEASGKNRLGFDENLEGGCLEPVAAEENEYISTLGSIYLKTTNEKNLWMQLNVTCGNFTYIGYQPPNGELQRNVPDAMVRVRVKVTDTKSGEIRYALPDASAGIPGLDGIPPDLPDYSLTFYEGDGSGAVFCRRTKTLMTKHTEISDYGNDPTLRVSPADGGPRYECFEDDPEYDGSVIIEPACLLAEDVTVIVDQQVMNTSSFLLPDVGSEVQEIEVQAWLDTDSFAQPQELSAAATVGLGSLIVQIPHMVPSAAKPLEGTFDKPVSLD